jgi:endonuclease-3
MGTCCGVEERMKVEARTGEIITLLRQEHPEAKIALNFKTPLELLVATILSAQCTDVRVNQVTKALFKKYQKAEDYAEAQLSELEEAIRPTGFYRKKARNIRDSCKTIVERFDSHVPDNMDDLLKLRGVGRKTANIILSNGFGVVAGIAVDTHVRRLSQRLGFTENKNPTKFEMDLMRLVPQDEWSSFSHLLSAHGRRICKARRPLCSECVLGKRLCPSTSSIRVDVSR